MAVTDQTLRLIDGMRIAIHGNVDRAGEDLIRAWAVAWTEIAGEWEMLLTELAATRSDGQWPTRAQILRATRTLRVLELTRAKLLGLQQILPVRVVQSLRPMTDETLWWHERLTTSQLPYAGGITWTRVAPDAIDAIVTRTTQRVHSLANPIAAQAERAMKATLIRGIQVGENPRIAAARMLQRVGGAFNGGRNRALVIARTEMLDAHRAAGRASDNANADILGGWQWVATLDKRTCPSCWGKHGNTYQLDEPGPLDHQQGRCARVPVTKSWADLGFPQIVEPASILPDAQETFWALPAEDQLAVMGRDRLELLRSGAVAWSDLSQLRTTAGWRDSYHPTPIKTLRASRLSA